MLFRWGFVADLINFVVGLPTILIIYFLFKRTNTLLLQLAVAFVIIQTATIAVNLLNQISPLLILSNDTYLKTCQPDQLATLSLLSLNIQSQGYAIGLVFFGFYCLIVGYVIYKSKFLPKIFGILYALTGLCYLINSFTMFLSKGFENPLFMYLAIPILIGDLSFCLWLPIKGVDTSEMLGLIAFETPQWLYKYGLWIVASIFAFKSIGDINYVGYFKKIKQTKFGKNDTKCFSALCLTIGLLTIILELKK